MKKFIPPGDFVEVIRRQAMRKWNIYITPRMTKNHLLGYAGRYIRRLPISQRRILSVSPDEVIYQSKDSRTKTYFENRCTPEGFVALISQHVPDHYQHSMRYFGLLVPRTKSQTQFIEGHGGQISITSQTDAISHGTTLRIFVPLRTPYARAALNKNWLTSSIMFKELGFSRKPRAGDIQKIAARRARQVERF